MWSAENSAQRPPSRPDGGRQCGFSPIVTLLQCDCICACPNTCLLPFSSPCRKNNLHARGYTTVVSIKVIYKGRISLFIIIKINFKNITF